MSAEQEKAASLARRLWENPSLAGFSPLQKEEQLQQFLDINASALQPSMAAPQFFPGTPWTRVRELVGRALTDMANETVAPMCESVLREKMDFSFIKHLEYRTVAPASVRDQLGSYLGRMARKAESRRELIGPLLGVGRGVVDRYMNCIFKRKRYISFELLKVQRLKMSEKEVGDLVKATMLLRPSVQFFLAEGTPALRISTAFAGRVIKDTVKELTLMPETVVKAAIHSSLSFQDNSHIESTGRLAAILSHRCRNLKTDTDIDRGAEASDKSWFSVARKNYKFYGFDLDMLVELHGIAVENGW